MVLHKGLSLVPYFSYFTQTTITKLLYIAMYTSLQKIQIYSTVIDLVNHNLKHFCQWLRNNKISSNASKIA